MIVADTNVVSELMRQEPSPIVVTWVDEQDEFYTTSITVAEIRYGIERLPEGKRRDLVEAAAVETFTLFENHILSFGHKAAALYGGLVADRERAGSPIGGFDAQIAAICRQHSATLATRNRKDFDGTGISLVNPWDG